MGKASVLIVLSDSIIQGRLSLFQFKFQNLHKIFYALKINNRYYTFSNYVVPVIFVYILTKMKFKMKKQSNTYYQL